MPYRTVLYIIDQLISKSTDFFKFKSAYTTI